MRLIQPLKEGVVRQIAEQSGPDSAAARVLAEAAEIKARGSAVRFWLTADNGVPGLCCQEGVAFISTREQ